MSKTRIKIISGLLTVVSVLLVLAVLVGGLWAAIGMLYPKYAVCAYSRDSVATDFCSAPTVRVQSGDDGAQLEMTAELTDRLRIDEWAVAPQDTVLSEELLRLTYTAHEQRVKLVFYDGFVYAEKYNDYTQEHFLQTFQLPTDLTQELTAYLLA